jgi:hypothetical protein
MSYVLILGFQSLKYKKDPQIRVYVNNHFVDEFDLPGVHKSQPKNRQTVAKHFTDKFLKHMALDVVNKKHLSDFFPKHLQEVKQMETFSEFENVYYRIFELNPDVINKEYQNATSTNQVKIVVKNSDNNYTNGFMTKSTLVSLKGIFLMPKSVLHNGLDFFKKYALYRNKVKTNGLTLDGIKNYYTTGKNPFLYIPNDKKFDYINELSYSLKNSAGAESNQERHSFFGDDGTYKVTWKTNKHTITEDRSFQLSLHLMYILLNKYTQYENHRDNS